MGVLVPSVSAKQHRFMEMVAHDPAAAKRVGVSQSVAEDYVKADAGQAGAASDKAEVPDGKPKGKRRGQFKRKGKSPTQDGAAENDLGTSTKQGY